MRIVIDGASGSGKTTFLSCNYLSILRKERSQRTINIASLGYPVFSEMMQGAVNEAKELKIIPPIKKSDWNQLFYIIYKKGIEQFNAAENGKISWYDRGLHFLKAFADINNFKLPEKIYSEIKNYKYDYVFVFKPIDEFDLSMPNNGKFGPMSLSDRYKEFQAIIESYQEFGHSIFIVPVFSNNLEENFEKRLLFIKERVSCL